jgi:molybdopterin-binding protein
MKVGARNRIVGKVESIQKGSVMCLVKLKIEAPANMASVMTLESLKELGKERRFGRSRCEGRERAADGKASERPLRD